MCKFTVLYQYKPEVKEYYQEKRGKAFGYGASLMFLQKLTGIQDATGHPMDCYAFRLKGSILSYLRFKNKNGKYATTYLGWN